MKKGGPKEGKWRVLISGPKVTGLKRVKTLYSEPNIENALLKASTYLDVNKQDLLNELKALTE